MLIAKNDQNRYINVGELTYQQVEKLKSAIWYCPTCKNKVILKNGQQRISHFAHRAANTCQAFSEGETREHLLGKQAIIQWCKRQQLFCRLEAYLPELAQRPDILIGNRLAIEFQCSVISIADVVKRTNAYHKEGYQVIWIAGRKLHFHVKKQLTALQRAMCNFKKELGFYFWELDVECNTIHLCYHIEEVEGQRKKSCVHKNWDLQKVSLAELNSFVSAYQDREGIVKSQLKICIQERWQQIKQAVYYKSPQIRKLQNLFYQDSQNILFLSIVYFLPVNYPISFCHDMLYWKFLFWKTLQTSLSKYKASRELLLNIFQEMKAFHFLYYAMPNANIEIVLWEFLKCYFNLIIEMGFLTIRFGKIIDWHLPPIHQNITQQKIEFEYFIERKPYFLLFTENLW